MATIFDYLEWRGDISLAVDPFNDVDNLVLAELSYTEFGKYMNETGTTLLSDIRKNYFIDHSREEIQASDDILARTALLMDGTVTGVRFGGLLLQDFVSFIDIYKNMQMAAVTFLLDDGTAYVAFRGTDHTIVGWKEDFYMSYLRETVGQKAAIDYLNRVGSKLDCPIRVGGHSKGGNFAVYAAAFCKPEIQDKITAVYTNDGPGFRSEVMNEEGYLKILPKIRSIVPETSFIGLLLNNNLTHQVVKSSEKLLLQHDGMTWQVHRNEFVPSAQTEVSKLFEQTQKAWLGGISDESRESFVNSLFSTIESTGVDTFPEIGEQKIKSIERVVTSVRGMPKDKQAEFLKIAGVFLQNGGHVVIKQVEEIFINRNREKGAE